MCVAGEQKCDFQTHTHTHICVPGVRMCVPGIHVCCQMNTRVCVCVCVFRFACTHVCGPRVHICVFTCTHMRVARVHICVFTCTHMRVLIRHAHVVQENTCLFSDEHVCVCLPPVHMCVFTCTHMFHLYTFVCSRAHMCVPTGHVFVLQDNTCLVLDEHSSVSVSARA